MKTQDHISIDGAQGEGGGQVLRSSLALSLVTGRAFEIVNIRAGRKKPGLLRQHLTAVTAAARVGGAEVEGAEPRSTSLRFRPGAVGPIDAEFAVGTAGSTTLVLQTVLPALLTASGPSKIRLEGGTHNPFAPPFDFLEKTFLPLIARMGPKVTATLERPGFFPAGGGRFTVAIEPSEALKRIDLLERGGIHRRCAVARVAGGVPRRVAEREVRDIARRLSMKPADCHIEEVTDSLGPGNIVTIELESDAVTEVFTGFGERGVPAETVARSAMRRARKYIASDAPVGEYLADQLLLPMAIAGGGSFRTLPPTRHTLTNADVIRTFLDVDIDIRKETREAWRVTIESTGDDR